MNETEEFALISQLQELGYPITLENAYRYSLDDMRRMMTERFDELNNPEHNNVNNEGNNNNTYFSSLINISNIMNIDLGNIINIANTREEELAMTEHVYTDTFNNLLQLLRTAYPINNNNIAFDFIQPAPVLDSVPLVLATDELQKLKPVDIKQLKEDYLKDKPNEEFTSTCSICLEDIEKEAIIIPCKHFFHEECIKEYLENYNHKCPVCREICGKHEAKIGDTSVNVEPPQPYINIRII